MRALDAPLDEVLVDDGEPLDIDPALLAEGRAHLEWVRRAAPRTWNGPILGFRALNGDTVVAGRTDYFTMLATSDALAAEAGTGALVGPMRRRAAAAAGGDPRRRGDGRGSVVGIAVLVRIVHDGGSWLLLGRRRGDLAVSSGLVSTIDGCAEPGTTRRPLAENVFRELAEEAPGLLALAGIDGPRGVRDGARLLGVSLNLLRLSPTISLELPIEVERPPDRAGLLAGDEFTESILVPATRRGLAEAWADPRLAPPAAGALALWERRHGLGPGRG
jgi:hypothetical protein